VIDYEIVVLDQEQFTSTAQMLMCCWNAGLQWQARNRSTVHTKNGRLTQPLALEQPGFRTGALLKKNIDQAVKKCMRSFPTAHPSTCLTALVARGPCVFSK
jgi:hypothetical protein